MQNVNGRQIQINDINTKTLEGRLLMSALARLTVRVDMDKTPDQCLQQILDTSIVMYKDSDPLHPTSEAVKQLCQALIDDADYYRSWGCQYSMAFVDEYHRDIPSSKIDSHIRDVANKGAVRFLEVFIANELDKFPKKVFLKHSNGELEELSESGKSLNRKPDERNFSAQCQSPDFRSSLSPCDRVNS